MKRNHKKAKKRETGKRCISANEDTFALADARMKHLRMDSFSEYCRHLIRRDLAAGDNEK